jgi:membrane associated rhomboid family serine protease
MPRYPGYAGVTYQFGPGPITPAVKFIIWANVAMFLLMFFLPGSDRIVDVLALRPQDVFERGWLWQPVTYMFLHGDLFHILFNLLGIWMFGVELERMWGTQYFSKLYAISGLGAAATMLILGWFSEPLYRTATIGASGAFYGLLLAYGMVFAHRPILLFFLFPVPARYAVMIFGAIAFLGSTSGARSGTAHAAHLGGLVTAYIFLKGGRGGLSAEIKYRYVKWKMNRLRKKFDVYSGGRGPWDRNVH